MGLLNALPGAVAQGLIWGIMAIGLYITYKILDFSDLTVDGSITTGAAVCAMLCASGVNVWIAMLCALMAGMLAGLVTGFLHTVMGIPAILSGILTQLMLWSVNLKIMGKANQAISARNVSVVVSQLFIPRTIFTLVGLSAALIFVLYWFFGTEFGCSIRATGCSLPMSRSQGINTSARQVFGLALSNGIVALAGALLAQYSGAADINMGRGAIVVGLAAVIIGDAIFSKITHNFALRLAGVLGGGIIYYVIYQVVIFLGLDSDLLKMLSAIIVAIFLAVPHLKKTYFSKKKKGGAARA